MKNLIIILLSFITISCSSQNENKTDWIKDIEFLKTELPKKHKNLFFKNDKSTFENGLDQIKLQQANLSDFEIAIKLQQLIASFGDSHTSVKWKKYIDNKKILPIRLYWFSDGIYVTKTTKANKELLGKKITGINGNSIAKITDSLSTLITVDNKAIIKDKIPKLIIITQLLDFFDFSNGREYSIEVETKNGIKSTIPIKPYVLNTEKLINITIDTIAYCWRNTRISFTEKFVDNVYYLQYNQCVNKSKTEKKGKNNTISFNEYKKKVFKTIKEKSPDKLIFDMRFNSGGNSYQGTKFINQLAKQKGINQKGKLFVIIGRKTFSSAIINTLDFIENTNAIIVGENTGGKPNHYGEIRSFELPNSRVTIIYSTKYFKRTDREMNTIKPDIEIGTSFNDFINGIDPIFEWIKKQ